MFNFFHHQPTLIGVSSTRLRDVLHSTDLAIHTELPVKDKSASLSRGGGGHSQSSSRSSDSGTPPRDVPVIGKLKVII